VLSRVTAGTFKVIFLAGIHTYKYIQIHTNTEIIPKSINPYTLLPLFENVISFLFHRTLYFN